MAVSKITKTIIYPCPTEWMGQTQSTAKAGVSTYNGPAKLLTWWYIDQASRGKNCVRAVPSDSKEAECPTESGCVAVELDPQKYPLHALDLWGCAYGPEHIEVQCGPSSDPNPAIADPNHFTEVFDLKSFYYDTTTNQWSTPEFSNDNISPDGTGEEPSFGWAQVRKNRNAMLVSCDSRVSGTDIPDALKQPWIDYRQKLRDIPADWAGIGTVTRLIVWPKEPDAGNTSYGPLAAADEAVPDGVKIQPDGHMAAPDPTKY